MISKFDDHFNKLLKKINSNNKFILGLSGGIDSMALLHLIKNFANDKRNASINCMPIIIGIQFIETFFLSSLKFLIKCNKAIESIPPDKPSINLLLLLTFFNNLLK